MSLSLPQEYTRARHLARVLEEILYQLITIIDLG